MGRNMQPARQTASFSTKSIWAGRIVSALAALLLLVDAVMKVLKERAAVEGTIQVGYPESSVVGIGVALLVSTLFYMIPQTSVLGAILLTGYLGGAIATNVRINAPLFGNILVPVYVGVLVWGGLYLRDDRLRVLIPHASLGCVFAMSEWRDDFVEYIQSANPVSLPPTCQLNLAEARASM
jgi:hypothetical protein